MTNNWDDMIDKKLGHLFGFEKFNPEEVPQSFDEKKEYFKIFIDAFKHRNLKVITVAGTNGKGETARLIASHLKPLNLKCALWTSPHIVSVRERFQIDEISIDESTFEVLLNRASLLNLTYYETLFYIFCLWVHEEADVEVLILEVGLGGRLDAVNFFDADVVCLTSIARDHCHILGHRLIDILKEKLGVSRPEQLLISTLETKYLNEYVKELSARLGVTWYNLSSEYEGLSRLPYWQKNMLLSLCVKEFMTTGILKKKAVFLPLTDQIPQAHVSPGRFEEMTLKKRSFIFIGAHNLSGLRALVKNIFSRVSKLEKVNVWFSASDRDESEVLAMLDLLESCPKLCENIKLCLFKHPKAMSKQKLDSILKERQRRGKSEIELLQNWLEEIKEKDEGSHKVLLIGSYYFIGEVQKYILQNLGTRTTS